MQPDKKGLVVEVEISSLSLGRPWAHCLHEEWSAHVRSEAENRAINLRSRLRTIVAVKHTPIPFSLQLLLSFPLFRALRSLPEVWQWPKAKIQRLFPRPQINWLKQWRKAKDLVRMPRVKLCSLRHLREEWARAASCPYTYAELPVGLPEKEPFQKYTSPLNSRGITYKVPRIVNLALLSEI